MSDNDYSDPRYVANASDDVRNHAQASAAFKYATPALCDYHEVQCNRFVNGGCATVRCVRRGKAANPGEAPLLSPGQLSTCEAFETAHIIAAIIGREYGPDYDIGEVARLLAHKAAEFRP